MTHEKDKLIHIKFLKVNYGFVICNVNKAVVIISELDVTVISFFLQN